MSNNKIKYSMDDLKDFNSRLNDLMKQCMEINAIIDEMDNTKYDLVKSYSTYLLYSGAIETLINQAILYRFNNNTLNYFRYFVESRGNFIEKEKLIELLGKAWLDNFDYNSIKEFLDNRYDSKIIESECFELDRVRIIEIYDQCRRKRNGLAHSIKNNGIEFSNNICCQFEIIIYVIKKFVEENILNNSISNSKQ